MIKKLTLVCFVLAIILVLLFVFPLARVFAQFSITWDETWGGTEWDRAQSVVVTLDGGYAIVGYSNSFGEGGDAWLVKTDASGNMVWQKTYGETAGAYGISEDVPDSVIQTVDGGYVLAGFASPSAAGGCDAWLVKVDASGNMVWNQTCGASGKGQAHCVVQTSDGGYVLAAEKTKVGTQDYDFWLIKIEPEDTTEPTPSDGAASALPKEYVYLALIAVLIFVAVIAVIVYRKRK